MPNWCSNSITITGPIDQVKDLWTRAQTATVDSKDGETSFGLLEAMVPQPNYDEVDVPPALGEKKIMSDWWDWRVTNWGTKWDVSDEGLEFTDCDDGYGTISGWFESAWAPPIEAYNTFLENNEEFSIRSTYEEGGMDFAGIYEDGDDEGMDGLSEWCEKIVRGECELEDTPELFQRLDEEYDLVENRREYIEEEMEQERVDEKNGVYPQHEDVTN